MRRSVVLVALAAVAALAGCGGDEKTATVPPPPSASVTTTVPSAESLHVALPRKLSRHFLKTCVAGGGEPAVCACVLVRLSKTATVREIEAVSTEGKPARGRAKVRLRRASRYCLSER